jgi:endonuclease/exonuclease/phosphatase family metal-dependent hydrolase
MLSRLSQRLFIVSIAALVVPCVPPLAAQPAKSRTVKFCFWNVENLFDDKENPKLEKVDREFDQWFAKDKEALHHKLARIADVLLSKEMNKGFGPDVLAMAEVESLRAVELVRDTLNAKLKDKALHYKHIAYLDPRGGRSIATAVLSRVPFAKDKPPRLLGRSQRMLELTLVEGKHELVVMASHWTSRVSDGRGTGRASYAQQIYRNFAETYKKSPGVKYLVCGDFNDTPTDESVARHLNATGDVKKVLALTAGDRPLFYSPFAEMVKDKKGTHFYQGQPYIFDNICLSPGLLESGGWSYVPKSAAIVELLQFRGRPDRFGGPADKRPWRNRGASDHFPVTVEFRVPVAK